MSNDTTAESIVRSKLSDGRTICTPDVIGLLREIERLRAILNEAWRICEDALK